MARSNLDKFFSYVGFVEDIDHCWPSMEERFGWQIPPENHFHMEHRLNVTVEKPAVADLTPSELEAVKGFNHLDIALYEWAKEYSQIINSRPVVRCKSGN
jgi:hypothetical protein